MRLFLVHFLYT